MKTILDYLFRCKVIVNCDRDVYLLRWFVIRTNRLGLFVHKFVRSDEDRALHDHPWSFLVIPIWRGYVEHTDRALTPADMPWARPDQVWGRREPLHRRVWPIIGTRFRDATYRHRVELIEGKPSWSIFLRFRRKRDWGFHTPSGWVKWNKWWADTCNDGVEDTTKTSDS